MNPARKIISVIFFLFFKISFLSRVLQGKLGRNRGRASFHADFAPGVKTFTEKPDTVLTIFRHIPLHHALCWHASCCHHALWWHFLACKFLDMWKSSRFMLTSRLMLTSHLMLTRLLLPPRVMLKLCWLLNSLISGNHHALCWHHPLCWHFFSLLKKQHKAWWTVFYYNSSVIINYNVSID